MRLNEVSLLSDSESVRLVGAAERAGKHFEVYFRFSASARGLVSPHADPFVAAMLLPAMKDGETLEIVPPVSARLIFGLRRVRDLFHAWYPEFKPIEIHAVARTGSPPKAEPRAASFFSGGVDSFYTLLRRLRSEPLPVPLTHILFMRGVETSLDRIDGIEDSERAVGEVASALGLSAVIGESNLRSCFPLDYEKHYFGSVLGAVALSLSQGFSQISIPATFSYNHIVPEGSNPVSDEMFGTEDLQIWHDGAEASRPEKVERIVGWERDLVLRYLRVCYRNRGGAFNCGRCPKCVRTAVALHILGIRADARIFRDTSTAHWRESLLQDQLVFVTDNLLFARQHGAEPWLIKLLESVVRRRTNIQALRTLLGGSALRHLLPVAPRRLRARLTGSH